MLGDSVKKRMKLLARKRRRLFGRIKRQGGHACAKKGAHG
jgi:hypothetical protein